MRPWSKNGSKTSYVDLKKKKKKNQVLRASFSKNQTDLSYFDSDVLKNHPNSYILFITRSGLYGVCLSKYIPTYANLGIKHA